MIKRRILGVVLLLVVLAGFLWVWRLMRSPGPGPCAQTAGLQFLDPSLFNFLGDADAGPGRRSDGDALDANGTVVERGFQQREDLQRYLLRFADGHPGGEPLRGGSWSAHVRTSGYPRICDLRAPDKVLVVQAGQKLSLDDAAVEVAGLVVRTGGVLLVAGSTTLRTTFVLVESGGLLQAGSRYASSHRYDAEAKFSLVLTNGSGAYRDLVNVASQYSSDVYAPGITSANASAFGDFTGALSHHLSNCFGKKSVCVGFNGNLHFAGDVGPELEYRATWDAADVSDPSSPADWFGPEQRLSVGSSLLRKTYPVTWLRLVGKAAKGAKEISYDRRDAPAGFLGKWLPGAQVLITGCPDQYFTTQNPTGLLPLWVDNDDEEQRRANEEAKFPYASASGLEVQRIARVDEAAAIIYLQDGLRFDHDARPAEPIERADGKKVQVDQPLHVCLLTRNVLVTSELTASAGGCNELSSTGDAHTPGVVCNQAGPQPIEDVTSCYRDLTNSSDYCGDLKLPSPESVRGHWIFGSDGIQGCGAIHGGQCLFRYGSAVHLDAVELKYMGTPGNFGSIAQYAVHFHMAGYARSFLDFLPATAAAPMPRESNVHNCSIWLSLSRWVTLHGTLEASISNNVGFFCLGSGFFIEDGTEMQNVFEHNVGSYALPGVVNAYYNPIPLLPNVSSDFGPMATFWMKNNFNAMARNVACASPAPVVGFWLVPQPISLMRGPSALLLGSEALGLPGLASAGNAANDSIALKHGGQSNSSGAVVAFSGRTPCWVPDGFRFPLLDPKTKCNIYNTDNVEVPLWGFMENVCYGMYMFLSVLPEQIKAGPVSFRVNNGECLSALDQNPVFGIGWQSQDNQPRGQWMPSNGQNACVDAIVGVYPESRWRSDVLSNPLGEDELTKQMNSCATRSQVVNIELLPFVLSGCLGFCFSSFRGQAGGAMWFHQGPAWLLNCALLQKSVGDLMPRQTCSTAAYQGDQNDRTNTQTFVSNSSSENDIGYSTVYPVYYNLLTNGAFNPPSNPTLLAGSRSCYPKQGWIWGDTQQECKTCLLNVFCDFGLPLKSVLPATLSWGFNFTPSEISVYELNDEGDRWQPWQYSSDGALTQSTSAPPQMHAIAKFPYVCDVDKLREDAAGHPAANLVLGQFEAQPARSTGDAVCRALARVPPCFGQGGAAPKAPPSWPQQCRQLYCGATVQG